MRTEALYNNQILYLADYFTTKNGIQIAIEGQIEKLREYGNKNQLVCTCGCGGKLTVVSGKEQKRRPHFRLKREQKVLCRAHEESPITINAKYVLKCWLDDVFSLQVGDVKYNTPINQVGESTRRYEYTLYVSSKKLGIYYEANEGNLNDEKIGALSGEREVITICITDIANSGCVGQYPEFGVKAQKLQGYCAFLSADTMLPYEEAKLKIVRYEKSYEGIWVQIDVCEDRLSEYAFNLDNKLCIGELDVEKLALAKASDYIAEQEELKAIEEEKAVKAKQQRMIMLQEEAERRKIENEKKECERKEEEERQEELKKKSDEICRKIKLLELYLNKCNVIGGIFRSVFMKDNTSKQGYEKIYIHKVNYNWQRHRFEIMDTTGKQRYIFLQIDKEIPVDTSYTWDGHSVFSIYDVDVDNLISSFQDKFSVIDEEYEKAYICTLEYPCPNKEEQSNICIHTTEDNRCGYRKCVKNK